MHTERRTLLVDDHVVLEHRRDVLADHLLVHLEDLGRQRRLVVHLVEHEALVVLQRQHLRVVAALHRRVQQRQIAVLAVQDLGYQVVEVVLVRVVRQHGLLGHLLERRHVLVLMLLLLLVSG
jgi:hypothetical protein